jgi:hypothetical protein
MGASGSPVPRKIMGKTWGYGIPHDLDIYININIDIYIYIYT